jgi:hypothetical protein
MSAHNDVNGREYPLASCLRPLGQDLNFGSIKPALPAVSSIPRDVIAAPGMSSQTASKPKSNFHAGGHQGERASSTDGGFFHLRTTITLLAEEIVR